MTSTMLVGLAGLFFGGGMSAARARAPRRLVAVCYVSAALSLMLVVLLAAA